MKRTIHALILWLAASATLLAPSALAEVPNYFIVPDKSSLQFIATQNGAPLKGAFRSYKADIKFDPQTLEQSSIKVMIDVNSVDMADPEIADTLKMPEWFSASAFPEAVYESRRIKRAEGDNNYVAEGTLTLKNASVPVTLYFQMEHMAQTHAIARGHTILNRADFSVGEGEWSDTSTIKNEVRVEFYLHANKQ